jgi:hypothetical protein
MNHLPVWIAIAALASCPWAGSIAHGQEPARPDDAKAAHLARMKALASTFHVLAAPDNPQSRADLIAEPVLRYADNTRQIYESSLWIWGTKGRPSAVMAIEFYPDHERGPRWLFEVASLSAVRIAVRREPELTWTANQPGLDFKPVAAAEAPAARPAQRLLQMKTLRERFAIHEHTATEGRIELRPLSRPLHRYEDSAGGLVDGAIFSYANGTNPEVLLALEARQSEGKSSWVYGLAQMTGASVTARLDGNDVWERGVAYPPAVRESYVNGWIPLATDARPDP